MLRQSEIYPDCRTPIMCNSECTVDLISQPLEDLCAQPSSRQPRHTRLCGMLFGVLLDARAIIADLQNRTATWERL
jgi:hypothetical protein